MENIFFPHEKPRDIQLKFMEKLLEVIKNKQNFLVHAPTGIGKTASAISPALEYAIKNNKTVFFLTSRHTQHLIAVETLKKLKERHSINFNSVDLVGKQWMCNQPGVKKLASSEFSEYCKELRKKNNCIHYKNLKYKNKISVTAQMALKELKSGGPMHVEQINQICSDRLVCPFEMACLLGRDANVIIADYYHILHPSIRESLFKRIGKEINDCIIIFDEAHNLPQRARNLLTSQLSSYVIDLAVKEARDFGTEELAGKIIKINDILLGLVKSNINIQEEESYITKKKFILEIEKICAYGSLISELEDLSEEVFEIKKRSFASIIVNFLKSWPGTDEGFVRILSRKFGYKSKIIITLSYKCLDPSLIIRPLSKESHSLVIMSGTLTPANMYKDLFGLPDAVITEFENPFPKENRLNLIIPETSTKYTSRCKEMYQMIADKCSNVINSMPGNCAVFFPSYYLRDEVMYYLKSRCEKTIFAEQSGMAKQERGEMLERFKSYKDSGAVLLGVSSGSFGEGIDLLGDYLKSVIVVGLPLSKPDLETKKLIEYYDSLFGQGWDYGYIFPAIIKTMQNAGRCIRSKKDRGVIIFLDERYIWNKYYRCFPKDWNMKVSIHPEQDVRNFFEEPIPL